MVLYCTTQSILSSRNRVLYFFLKKNLGNYFIKNENKNKSIFSNLNLIIKHKPKVVIIGFNSRILFLFLWFFKFKNNFKLIYDLGYPVTDINDLNFFRKKILVFLDFIGIKTSDLILLESKEQKCIFSNRAKFSLVHYAYTEYEYKDNNEFYPVIDSKYILFRGRLNEESGIINCINAFQKYKINGSLSLVIHGWGKLESKVRNEVNKNPSQIILIDSFLKESEMLSLIKNSEALIGQSKKSDLRLQKTIPHKCFEAIFFNKPYLSFLYPPLLDLFEDKYELIGLQLDPNKNNFIDIFNNLENISVKNINSIAKMVKSNFESKLKKNNDKLIKTINDFIKY